MSLPQRVPRGRGTLYRYIFVVIVVTVVLKYLSNVNHKSVDLVSEAAYLVFFFFLPVNCTGGLAEL